MSEIHGDESVELASFAEIAEHERTLGDHRTVEGPGDHARIGVLHILRALAAKL